jgi:hypothetical protein
LFSSASVQGQGPTQDAFQLQVTNISSTTISVVWSVIASAETQEYVLFIASANSTRDAARFTNIVFDASSPATLSYTIKNTKPFSLNFVWITSLTASVNQTSETLQVTTNEDVPDAAPFPLVSEVGSSSVFITWSALPSENQNGIIISYDVLVTLLVSQIRNFSCLFLYYFIIIYIFFAHRLYE